MKRLLLLAAVLGFTSTASAQVPRKVLIEKFTNTGCPPCAVSDPWFEEFEASNMSKITVIKYHTQGPDPTDPYYMAQATTKESNNRAAYYELTGVPTMYYDGAQGTNPGVGVAAMQSLLDESIQNSTTSPYKMSVTQSIEGDSIIALVTVEVQGAAAPDANRIAVVFTERYNKFTGNNGTPFHTDIARKVVPGLVLTGTNIGELATNANYPAFAQTAGTQTYRFAAKIGATWNRAQLASVAFIQATSTKQVYQTEWTVPAASVTGTSGFQVVSAGNGTSSIAVSNQGLQPVTLKANVKSRTTPGWSVSVEGLDANQSITVPAGGSTDLTLATVAKAKGSAMYDIEITNESGAYVGAISGSLFGEGNTIAIVNGSSDPELGYGMATSIYATEREAGVISRSDFMETMSSWDDFSTVLYAAGPNVGIQIGTGEWENAASFVSFGGNFGFFGTQMVSAYAKSGNEAYMDNIRDIFGVDPLSARTTTWTKFTGVDGDPVGNGVSTSLVAPSVRQDLEPLEDASIVFTNDKGDNVGVRNVINTGKTALMAFDLENLSEADRTMITDRLMDWFEGVASVKVGDASTTSLSNYPNPFNPSTVIEFSITEATPVTLEVKDMMGRKVASLIDYQMHVPGTYHQAFDASNLASGTYIYELTAGTTKITEKMILNK